MEFFVGFCRLLWAVIAFRYLVHWRRSLCEFRTSTDNAFQRGPFGSFPKCNVSRSGQKFPVTSKLLVGTAVKKATNSSALGLR